MTCLDLSGKFSFVVGFGGGPPRKEPVARMQLVRLFRLLEQNSSIDVWTAFLCNFGPEAEKLGSASPIIIFQDNVTNKVVTRMIVYTPLYSDTIWGLPNRFPCPCCGAGPSLVTRAQLQRTNPTMPIAKIAFECTRCLWCLTNLQIPAPPDCHVVGCGRERAYVYAYPPPSETDTTYVQNYFEEWKLTVEGKRILPKWLTTARGKAHTSLLTAIQTGHNVEEFGDAPDFSASDVVFHKFWQARRHRDRKNNMGKRHDQRKKAEKAARATQSLVSGSKVSTHKYSSIAFIHITVVIYLQCGTTNDVELQNCANILSGEVCFQTCFSSCREEAKNNP